MTDLDRAIAAARKALAIYLRYGPPHYGEPLCGYATNAIDALDDLLAALDAARGEAVAGSVQSGSVTIPFWVIDYAQKIELFMRVNGVDEWAIGGIQSRDLPPPQAQQPADAWINLYRRAVDVANDLTNYVEDRPKLLGAERKLDAIENEARALIAANKENTND